MKTLESLAVEMVGEGPNDGVGVDLSAHLSSPVRINNNCYTTILKQLLVDNTPPP